MRPDNQPLNVYASMPSTLLQYYGYESIAPEDYGRITLGHLRWMPFPVYKIPAMPCRMDPRPAMIWPRSASVTMSFSNLPPHKLAMIVSLLWLSFWFHGMTASSGTEEELSRLLLTRITIHYL